MKRILIALGCILAAVLLWFALPEEASVETINWGNDMQLIKRTSHLWGKERSLYGVNKHGTCLLAPIHGMIENEQLKLRVFYGPNSKIHIFNMETGEKVMTKIVSGYSVEMVWFCIDDEGEENRCLLMSRSRTASSPVHFKIDTVAVFSVKKGKNYLVKAM